MNEKLTDEEIQIVSRVVKRAGKTGKQLMREGYEDKRGYAAKPAKHLSSDKEEAGDAMNVRLAKKKLAEQEPLSPKDRIVLGFANLHGEGQ